MACAGLVTNTCPILPWRKCIVLGVGSFHPFSTCMHRTGNTGISWILRCPIQRSTTLEWQSDRVTFFVPIKDLLALKNLRIERQSVILTLFPIPECVTVTADKCTHTYTWLGLFSPYIYIMHNLLCRIKSTNKPTCSSANPFFDDESSLRRRTKWEMEE